MVAAKTVAALIPLILILNPRGGGSGDDSVRVFNGSNVVYNIKLVECKHFES